MSPSQFIEPFDFQTVYVNYFLGNQELFPFLFVIILSFASAYLNISNTIFLILLAIGSIMFGAYLGQAFYIFALFLIGFAIYKMFSRVFM